MKARTMWTRVWSMVVGGGVGLLLLVGMAGAQPFFGGLPGCLRELNTCTADLGMCETDLEMCQAQAQQFPATGQTSCWNVSDHRVSTYA